MNSADAAANWMCGPPGMPLQFVQSFATLRTEANMNPPMSAPNVTGADAQSEPSMTVGARFHGRQRPFARYAFPVGLTARRAGATEGHCAKSNAAHACPNIASACLMASTMG
jgi:hypothetical protein